MGNDTPDIVRGWLAAERAGTADEADRAFAPVALALPKRQPSRRFTVDVMARIALHTKPVVKWWTWWGVQTGVAASLVTLGVVLGTWSPRSMLVTTIASAQALVWGLDQVVTGSVVWIETALTLWGGAAHAAVVVGRLLVTPGPALLVGANLAVAASACVALQRLLAPQED